MIEVIIIFAMEACVGSAAYPACTLWLAECLQSGEYNVAETVPGFEHTAENCLENLPAWATEGM